MKPDGSILLLTTATGFGYGLIAWLGLAAAVHPLPPAHFLRLVPWGTGVGLVLVSAGLLASVFHLGNKGPAWRAFTQWRSSWLSREGVAALASYPVILGFAWIAMGGEHPLLTRLLGLAVLIASLGTVYCTSMIYASLKPIRQWHNAHTAPDYLLFALFSGAVLQALLRTLLLGAPGVAASATAAGAAALALIAKQAYWHHIDRGRPLATLASALGLPEGTMVKPLDAPHFTENFILREMGFAIARRHAAKLRRLVLMIAFVLPLLLSILGGVPIAPGASTGLAVLCAALGLLMERWLFFAEATHVSALYYGRRI